ncbi:MAG: HAMP domain-containing sensor histidine kinase [Gammaproteobacteria bacterium]|jgi:signal transduction histidine kinase
MRQTRHPVANTLGIALLIALVLLLAWLQFRWLNELREEEQARRRVALQVAATNYAEYLGQALNRRLAQVTSAGSVQAVAASEPLLAAVVKREDDRTARLRTPDDSDWRPATRATLQQRLGRPLLDALTTARETPGARLWLDPPAIVHCAAHCQAGILDPERLDATLLAPAARRMFADFGAELRVAVTVEGAGAARMLSPRDARPGYVRVTDLEQPLLAGMPVSGPPGSRWLLKVNHGGSSLEAAVAGSHLRNILLSGGVLGLLALSIGLVVFNARRQVNLAREHLYFVAGISHELRTPLSVISSAADNLADGTVEDNPRVREYGGLLQHEVHRLRDMIENVLQFAQSASATRPRVTSDVDMAALIAEVLDHHAARLAPCELRLELADPLPRVRGDRAALASALGNLVVNAAQYATDGNWIHISAQPVRVRPRGRALRIRISNPVAGRPERHPRRLFEPFYRGQQARAAGIPGTGIGLAVARNVAQQHGGGVSVDVAQPGIIRFSLILPVHE